ncbi:MAG: hypothetical protein WBA51_08640 [Erythrobacter sp.]
MNYNISLDDLIPDWNYTASAPTALTRLKRWASFRQLSAAPKFELLEALEIRRGRWIAQFFFCPTGELSASQLYTLARIMESTASKLIICATPLSRMVPAALKGHADLLYWKSMGGYDFSSYSIALTELSMRAPGSDVTLMNDSVFGPFLPYDQLWEGANWDVSGFTAASKWENHLQSYALQIRGVTPERLLHLRPIFRRRTAFNHYAGVVLNQESRLAAVAARTMTVGARWFSGPAQSLDPSLHAAVPLLEAGFPFLKKALFTKHSGIENASELRAALMRQGHPLED